MEGPTLSEYRHGHLSIGRAHGGVCRGKRPTFFSNVLLFSTVLSYFSFLRSTAVTFFSSRSSSLEDFLRCLFSLEQTNSPYEKVLDFLTAPSPSSRGSCLFFHKPKPPLIPRWICKDRWVLPEGTLLWKRLGSEQLNKIRKFDSHSNLPGQSTKARTNFWYLTSINPPPLYRNQRSKKLDSINPYFAFIPSSQYPGPITQHSIPSLLCSRLLAFSSR